MTKSIVRAVIALGVGVLLGITLFTFAAPIVPDARKVPDECRSVAGVREVRLTIHDIPGDLAAIALDPAKIAEDWKAQLANAGIAVTDNVDAPKLDLLVIGGVDPKIPESYGFAMLLELNQNARIERIDKTLQVPTYTKLFVGLVTEKEAADLAQAGLKDVLRHFLQCVALSVEQAPSMME